VISPESLLCPPQWAGIVALDDAILATVPHPDQVEPLTAALLRLARKPGIDLARLPAALPTVDVLGPATLAYLAPEHFAPVHPGEPVETLPADHPDLRTLLASVDEQDADECSLSEITSAAFVLRDGPRVIAAAGYRAWPTRAAHLSVLTLPEHRNRGLARIVSSSATAAALTNGLLPQWRARPEPSRRIARALGFHEIGAQISIRLPPLSPPGAARHQPR
jgi:RimJ/RimL family protein N-acetyltransferase